MYFIDSHCHLDRLDLAPYGGDLAKALEQARERGVDRMLVASGQDDRAGSAVGQLGNGCHRDVGDPAEYEYRFQGAEGVSHGGLLLQGERGFAVSHG